MYITQLVHRHLQQRPNHVAVVDWGQGEEYTFEDIADRVARFASAIQSLGVLENDRIGILSLNSIHYLEYSLAVPWAGCAINPVNIRWSANEIAYSLDDSDTRILLVDDAFLPLVEDIKSRSSALRTLIYIGSSESPEGMLVYEELVAMLCQCLMPCAVVMTCWVCSTPVVPLVFQRALC
ncbi:MAG: AMP-binding protein [Haliea sp.]